MPAPPGPPDVWVRDTAKNTPAHRVTDPDRYAQAAKALTVITIACPPGVVVGGRIISRSQAQSQQVFLCALCWGLDVVFRAARVVRQVRP
jgi:hypothetical protein